MVDCDATALITRVISAAYGRDAATRARALAIRDVAMSSIARVIFFVDWTVRTRRRYSRSWPATGSGLLDRLRAVHPDGLLLDLLRLKRVGSRLVDQRLAGRKRELPLELADRLLQVRDGRVLELAGRPDDLV